MKHLFIALALLAAVLTCSLYATTILDSNTTEIIQELSVAQDAAVSEDYALAYQQTKKAEALWQTSEGIFGTLLQHAETDEIHFLFSSLVICAEQPVKEEFRYRCEELMARLEHIAELDRPHYYNIF